LSAHILAGTFRESRHGAAAAAVLSMPSDWRPSQAQIAVLGPRARMWLDAALGLYRFDALEGERLLEALRVMTRIEVLEATDGMDSAAALVRERKLFLSMWAALEIGREA
jgi:hypothetical protein